MHTRDNRHQKCFQVDVALLVRLECVELVMDQILLELFLHVFDVFMSDGLVFFENLVSNRIQRFLVLIVSGLNFASVELGLFLAFIAGRRPSAQLVDAGDELFLSELIVVRFAHFADLCWRRLVQRQEEKELSEIDCS